MLGHLVMAWQVYKICGPEFWQVVKDLALTYLLPLPFFLMIAWIFPSATWTRFVASVVALVVLALLLMRRFAGPFRDFFFNRDFGAPAAEDGS